MEFLIFATMLIAVCGGTKTFGDVRKCSKESLQTCKTYCEKWHPAYKDLDKIKLCFEDKKDDTESCMHNHGIFIDDKTPCYPYEKNKNADHNSGEVPLPNGVGCYKRCMQRAYRRCRKDCTGKPTEEGRESWNECKNDDQLLDCIDAQPNFRHGHGSEDTVVINNS